MDMTLALMTGIDIPIVELQTSIHQPTIKEISYIGEVEYFSALQILCFEKNTIMAMQPEGANSLQNMNNFEIFMMLMNDAQLASKKNSVLSVLTILFPGYTAQLLPRGLYFNNATTKHNFTLDENNFDFLKKVLTEVGGMGNSTSGNNGNFNPKGKKAAEIAAKLMKARQKVNQNSGNTGSVLTRYTSILTIGLSSMSLNDCLNLTVFQLYDLIERYGLYVSWDLDIRSRLAGGKPDDKPDDWMKNIH